MPRLSELPPVRQARADYRPSLLTPVVATRLAQLADSLNMPPQAPIAIGVRSFRQELLTPPWLDDDEKLRRERLLAAHDEERFAAAYALLRRESPHDVAPSLAAVGTAVALRAYAQQSVWFPGFGGPTARELRNGSACPTSALPMIRRRSGGRTTAACWSPPCGTCSACCRRWTCAAWAYASARPAARRGDAGHARSAGPRAGAAAGQLRGHNRARDRPRPRLAGGTAPLPRPRRLRHRPRVRAPDR
jgi:hypothetical protein